MHRLLALRDFPVILSFLLIKATISNIANVITWEQTLHNIFVLGKPLKNIAAIKHLSPLHHLIEMPLYNYLVSCCIFYIGTASMITMIVGDYVKRVAERLRRWTLNPGV